MLVHFIIFGSLCFSRSQQSILASEFVFVKAASRPEENTGKRQKLIYHYSSMETSVGLLKSLTFDDISRKIARV